MQLEAYLEHVGTDSKAIGSALKTSLSATAIAAYPASENPLSATGAARRMKVRFLLDENLSPRLWGIVWIRAGAPINQQIESIALIWSASEAEEWVDQVAWIPF